MYDQFRKFAEEAVSCMDKIAKNAEVEPVLLEGRPEDEIIDFTEKKTE